MRFTDDQGLAALARVLASEYDLYAPCDRAGHLTLARLEPGAAVAWNAYRLAESLKPLWLQAGKVLSRWTAGGPAEAPRPRPRAVFGAKACDLVAVGILDRVLRDHTFQEPAWCAAREQNLIVAGDCTACGPSCFCTTLGGSPWPQELFDLSLAPVEGGWIVEEGSERGKAVLERAAGGARAPTPAELQAREKRRGEVLEQVRRQNAAWPTRDPFATSVSKNLRTRIWGKLAATCVECNACNLVCPTCHCFLLYDRADEDGAVRVRQWDSCFHAGYARMAGGGTPRLQLIERFKNHYFHKFVSFPRNWGVTACSGCGRCVDACMGRIDKRVCLHRLETEWMPTEVLKEVD